MGEMQAPVRPISTASGTAPPNTSPALRCEALAVSFQQNGVRVPILRDISFSAAPGEFVSLLGPSGCGKTTLLRTLAGLVTPESGAVFTANGPGRMVFQENALFPWMTVLDNACFGLEIEQTPRAERESRARLLLERYRLGGREKAYPHELSLGMKQRVAVIRGFLSNPGLLLMDEPFAALDWQMRLTLQEELLDLWAQDSCTVLFVTHDVDEAILLSDRILVLSPQPGTILGEYAVPFSRPRPPELSVRDEFVALKRRILADFGDRLTGARSAG